MIMVLSFSSLMAMEDEYLTIIKPDESSILWPLNNEQSLSDLKLALVEEGIVTTDVIQRKGSVIPISIEKKFRIKDAIDNNILHFKPRSSISSCVFGDITAPTQKADSSKYRQSAQFDLKVSPLEVGESLKEEHSVAPTVDLLYYADLSPENCNFIFNSLKLKNAINLIMVDSFDPSSKKEVKIDTSFRTSVTWDKYPDWQYPTRDLTVNRSYSLSKMLHELRKSNVTSITGGVSYLGIGADMEYKTKKETLNRKQDTEIYLLATYNVAKVELSIDEKFIKASSEIEEEIEKVVNNYDIDSYKKLIDIFSIYGFCVPTKFVLGGQIYCEDKKTVKSKDQAKKFEQSFAASVEVSFLGGSFHAGGGHTTGSSNINANSEIQHNVNKLVTGGDISLANDAVKWICSMSPIRAWRVIERSDFHPIYKFLNPELQVKCKELIQMFYKGNMSEVSLANLLDVYKQATSTGQFGSPLFDAWFREVENVGTEGFRKDPEIIFRNKKKGEWGEYTMEAICYAPIQFNSNYKCIIASTLEKPGERIPGDAKFSVLHAPSKINMMDLFKAEMNRHLIERSRYFERYFDIEPLWREHDELWNVLKK